MNKKQCAICGNIIPEVAKKCSICDSYQNWFRRKLNFSSLVLSLLVSLLAISGIVIPKIRKVTSKTNIILKQSNIEDSKGLLIYNNYISTYSGEEIGLELKKYFIPDNPDWNYSFYKDTSSIMSLQIDYEPDKVYVLSQKDSIDIVLYSDSIYYLIREEFIVNMNIELILRNAGEKYGIIHYLSLMKSAKELKTDFFELPSYEVLFTLFDNDPYKRYLHKSLLNKKIETEFIEAITFQISDTVNSFSVSNKNQRQFNFDYFDTTYNILESFDLKPLIFNHDNTLDSTLYPVEIDLVIRSEKSNTDRIK